MRTHTILPLALAAVLGVCGCSSRAIHVPTLPEGVEFELPQADMAEPDTNPDPDRIVVCIFHDPLQTEKCDRKSCTKSEHWQIMLGEKSYSQKELTDYLKEQADLTRNPVTRRSELVVMIWADVYAPFCVVDRAIWACAQSGLPGLEFAVTKTSCWNLDLDYLLPKGFGGDDWGGAEIVIRLRHDTGENNWRTSIICGRDVKFSDFRSMAAFIGKVHHDNTSGWTIITTIRPDDLVPWQSVVATLNELKREGIEQPGIGEDEFANILEEPIRRPPEQEDDSEPSEEKK